MGLILIWIESLTASLLLVALVAACSARLSRRWVRALLPILLALVLALLGLAMSVAGWYSMRQSRIHSWIFYYTSPWAVAFIVAGVITLRRGLRLRQIGAAPDRPPRAAAGSWPRARLGLATGAALLLCAMTNWNMNLAALNKLAATRAEAGALALSIAPSRPPDSQNAALLYEKAFELMEGDAGLLQRFGDGDGEEVRAFLEKHETALRLLRQGAAMPGWYVEWYVVYASPIPEGGLLMRELGDMRRGARLLALDARFQARQGRAGAALADVSAIFGMARHAGSGPVLIQALVAMAIGQIGHSALQAVLAHSDPSEADLDGVAADEFFSYWRLLRRSMRMEQAYGLSMFATTFESAGGAFFLLNELSGYRDLMKEMNKVLALPYHEAREGMKRLETQALDGRWGILQAKLFPALGRAASGATVAEAKHRLDNLALAATAYRIKHGTFPAGPEELVPDFMLFVPPDPFDGEPIRMVATDEGIVFYSIGPDMKDDGGAEWDEESETGDLIFRLPLPAAKPR